MHDDPGYTFLHVTKYPTEEMTDAARGLPQPYSLPLPGEVLIYATAAGYPREVS